jgi:hypothetical protein
VGGTAAVAMLSPGRATLVLVIVSFTGGFNLELPPPSWSIRWYRALITSDEIIVPALTSLKVARYATFIAGTLGTAAALAIARSRHPVARALDALCMSPMMLARHGVQPIASHRPESALDPIVGHNACGRSHRHLHAVHHPDGGRLGAAAQRFIARELGYPRR